MSDKFRSSIKHSFFGSYLTLATQLITSLIIARLLTPSEFGIYSVALVFATLAELFRNFGVNSYIIKEKELTQEKLESAFTILLLIAAFVSVTQFFSAPFIGTFYESIELQYLIQILVINIVISPFGAITQAQLMRDLRIKQLNIAQVSAQLFGAITSVVLAYSGWGVYSLAIGYVANNCLLIFLLRFFRYEAYPKRLGFSKFKEVLAFSGVVGFANVINHFGNSSQDWILGKTLGMESVGLYARGTTTVGLYDKLVTGALNKVLAPKFSELNRTGENCLPAFTKITSIQLSISWPFLLVMAYFSEPLIVFLYGDQWLFVGELLVWICLARMLKILTESSNALLIGLGEAKLLLRSNLVLQVVRIFAIVIALPYGLVMIVVAASFSVQLVRLIVYLAILKSVINLSIKTYFKRLLPPILVSLAACLPLIFFSQNTSILNILFASLPVVIIWFFMSKKLNLDVYVELQRNIPLLNKAA